MAVEVAAVEVAAVVVVAVVRWVEVVLLERRDR
jgi:hypothetical protein